MIAKQQQLIASYRDARRDESLAVLEGFHAIKHAMRFAARIRCMHGCRSGRWRGLATSHAPDIAGALHARMVEIDEALFVQLAPRPPDTGVIAIAERPEFEPASLWRRPRRAPIIVLDRPAHQGNTGAVIRSAAAAGALAVITTGPDDPWHPNVLRGAAGLHFATTVMRSSEEAIHGRPLIGLADNGEAIRDLGASIPDDAVLVFGSERHGLSAGLARRLDRRLALSMQPGVSSLNLAATAAIMLYLWRLGRSA